MKKLFILFFLFKLIVPLITVSQNIKEKLPQVFVLSLTDT